MEYKAICDKIPARISGIPRVVCKKPVTRPASIPDRQEIISASGVGIPLVIHITATAPPVASVPSTVKSAKFKILYVM